MQGGGGPYISVSGVRIPLSVCHTLVIGAGAAGLNCADELARQGIDVLLAADDFVGGTSRNAGSDKQTYHKLSLKGDDVDRMARGLFDGGHMHGDTAYALAAGSTRAFYKLVSLGVPFPHDEWGEFASYQTDHDTIRRATSAGPLTSRFMAERLMESCTARGVRRTKGLLLRLLTGEGRVCGALLMDAEAMHRGRQPLTAVLCGQVVLCTGGSADLYQDSVHPTQQIGAMGAALRIGARAANLWSWQYGIASKGVRWNLSGTYQQVLPLYVNARGEPVLNDWVPGNPDDQVFLKGYQWPFDGRKARGSSRVDLAVHAALSRGEPVYLDFRLPDAHGRLDALGKEAKEYLHSSGANQPTPFERLLHMNPAAVEFYRSHGINLNEKRLPIAVCAQHQNGGLAVDAWWRTSVPGLFAAGEVAGCFGAYRPGGSALNETQVGSLRAAQWIAARGTSALKAFPEEAIAQLDSELRYLRQTEEGEGEDPSAMHQHLRREFSLCAGPIRRPAAMKSLLQWVQDRRKARYVGDPADAVRLRDALDCAAVTLSSMLAQAQSMPSPAGHVVADAAFSPQEIPAVPDDRFAGWWIESYLSSRSGEVASTVKLVRPMPQRRDDWFENVWREYREGTIFDLL